MKYKQIWIFLKTIMKQNLDFLKVKINRFANKKNIAPHHRLNLRSGVLLCILHIVVGQLETVASWGSATGWEGAFVAVLKGGGAIAPFALL